MAHRVTSEISWTNPSHPHHRGSPGIIPWLYGFSHRTNQLEATTNHQPSVWCFFNDIRSYSIAGTFLDTNVDTSLIQKISILKLRFNIPIYDIPIKKEMETTRAINTSKTSIWTISNTCGFKSHKSPYPHQVLGKSPMNSNEATTFVWLNNIP